MYTRRWQAFVLTTALSACASAPEGPMPLRADAEGRGDVSLVASVPSETPVLDSAVVTQAMARVLDISHALRVRGRAWCGRHVAGTWGLAVGEPVSADAPVPVTHVVDGSAASQAGLHAGDGVVVIADQMILAGKAGLPAFQAAFDRARRTTEPVRVVVRRGDTSTVLQIRPEPGCNFRVAVARDGALDIGGSRLLVAGADASHLAAVMAAEVSRQMLRAETVGPSVGARAGQAVDATLSGLSLIVGIATLGGWSAKPVNIFGDTHAPSWAEAELDADLLALHLLAAAGHAPATTLRYLPSAATDAGRERLQAEAARIDQPPSPQLRAILGRLR